MSATNELALWRGGQARTPPPGTPPPPWATWLNMQVLRDTLANVRDWFARNTFVPTWLPRRWRHPAFSYLLAVLLQVFAIIITRWLVTGIPTFRVTGLLEMLALLVAALVCGAGPSLASTIVGVALYDVVVLAPPFALTRYPGTKLIELALFVAVGSAISMLAGQQERARQDAVAVRADLEAVQAVTDAALAFPGMDALLQALLERVSTMLAVDNVAVLLADAAGRELTLYLARGPEEEVASQVRVPVGRGVAGRIAATRAPLIIEDLRAVEVANPFLRERLRSLIGVPLLVDDRLIGVLHAATFQPRQFTQRELRLLQLAAERIALAVERAHLDQEVHQARGEAVARATELHATIEAIADGVVVFDRSGRLVQMNVTAQRLLGYDHQPEYPDPDGRASDRRVRSALGEALPPDQWPVNRVLRGEVITGAQAVDLVVQAAGGHDLQLSVSGAPVREEGGGILGAVCVFRDVTAQRALERRTRDALTALLAMAGSLVELTADPPPGATALEPAIAGREAPGAPPRAASPVAQHLAQLTRDVLGCQRVSLIAIEPETRLQRPIAVVGLAPEQEAQWWVEQLDHPVRYAEAADPALLARFEAGEAIVLDMTQPPYNVEPNPYGITTVLVAPMRVGMRVIGLLALDFGGPPHAFTEEDRGLAGAVAQLAGLVIERDRLLREREEARASELAAQETTLRYDQFLGIAGHELKTPITVIQANLQLTARHLTTANAANITDEGRAAALQAAQRLLARQARGVSRLTRLVEDLLDVSRIRGGSLALDLHPFDLLELVGDLVEEQRQLNPNRSLTLATAPADLTSVQVEADADRVRQVITNYLTNALKYSAAEHPVDVEVARTPDNARVAVRDHGLGLPPDERERVWEPFHRVEGIEVLSGSGVGLGLGLHISKTLVERNGGAVGVDSTPGEGATFWFTLPLAPG